MIYPYNTTNLNRWNHTEFKVQLNKPSNSRPIGYCDGTDADEEELRVMAESESVDELVIRKKYLSTGREIWTLGELPQAEWSEDQD